MYLIPYTLYVLTAQRKSTEKEQETSNEKDQETSAKKPLKKGTKKKSQETSSEKDQETSTEKDQETSDKMQKKGPFGMPDGSGSDSEEDEGKGDDSTGNPAEEGISPGEEVLKDLIMASPTVY